MIRETVKVFNVKPTEPKDKSRLNKRIKEHPHIKANVEAVQETFAVITDDGEVCPLSLFLTSKRLFKITVFSGE